MHTPVVHKNLEKFKGNESVDYRIVLWENSFTYEYKIEWNSEVTES